MSRAESALIGELLKVLGPVALGEAVHLPPGSGLCASLELVLPELLRAVYPVWEGESLDGVYVASATKTAATNIWMVGTGILMSDQTVTPLYAELGTFEGGTCLTRYRIGVGEPGGGRLGISGPRCHSHAASALLASVVRRVQGIAWVYEVLLRDEGRCVATLDVAGLGTLWLLCAEETHAAYDAGGMAPCWWLEFVSLDGARRTFGTLGELGAFLCERFEDADALLEAFSGAPSWPVSFAEMVGRMIGLGRIVIEPALYEGIAHSYGLVVEDLLPGVEGEWLVLHVVSVSNGVELALHRVKVRFPDLRAEVWRIP